MRSLVAALAALVLLTGCGSGNASEDAGPSSPNESPSTSAAPDTTSATTAQLRQAMAAVEHLHGLGKVLSRCPGGEYCGTGGGFRSVSVAVPLPERLTGSERETLQHDLEGWIPASVSLNVTTTKSAAAAAKALREHRTRLEKFAGSYSIAQRKSGKNSVHPGEEGTGESVRKATRDGWEGVTQSRRGTITAFQDTSPMMQSAEGFFAAGTHTVAISVIVAAKGRRPGEAGALLEQAIAAYFGALRKAS